MQFIYAVSLLTGTIIGVGLFGLPYVAVHSGLLIVLLYFLLGGAVVYVVNLIYGEIVSRTRAHHRLAGYAGLYLGKFWKNLMFVVSLFGIWGSIIAYLIIGGDFLGGLLSPYFGGSDLLYTLIYFAAGAVLVFSGVSLVKQAEFAMMVVFFGLVVGIAGYSLPFIKVENLGMQDGGSLFLPYGVILFSLWGSSVIPEIRELLGHGKNNLFNKVVLTSIILSIVTYILFIIVVSGTSGTNTTEDALTGLAGIFSRKVLAIGYVFGLITTFTSFISLGLTLKKGLILDYKFRPAAAGILALGVPGVGYLLGVNSFLVLIGFVGAVTLGIEGLVMFIIYLKIKSSVWHKVYTEDKLHFDIPRGLIYLLMLIFVVGICGELAKSFWGI